ncbi:hypothetical protein ACF1AX_31325 [Streptomyces sp. NPDC014802]|uniref:hypothetical protein n=1 Tax=Streptomyces sp. NPDC014802 TaxID=3364917 RepID=UPI0036F7FE89
MAQHPQSAFTRGFRLHHNGRVLDGAEFPSGRVLVVDDPEYGLASAAVSLEELLKGYHGARVEWPDDQLVPTALLLDLVNIARHVASGKPPVYRPGVPYPEPHARSVIAQLTQSLGYDVAERAAEQEASRALNRGETHL